jgi:hypothetical protein
MKLNCFDEQRDKLDLALMFGRTLDVPRREERRILRTALLGPARRRLRRLNVANAPDGFTPDAQR